MFEIEVFGDWLVKDFVDEGRREDSLGSLFLCHWRMGKEEWKDKRDWRPSEKKLGHMKVYNVEMYLSYSHKLGLRALIGLLLLLLL